MKPSLELLLLLCLIILIAELQSLLGDILELEAFNLGHSGDDHLVHRRSEEKGFVSPRNNPLDEGTLEKVLLLLSRAGEEEELSLPLLATSNDLGKSRRLVTGGRVETEELHEAITVLGILDDADFESRVGLGVELKVLLGILLRNGGEEVQDTLDEVLLDLSERLVLLQTVAADVEGEIVDVDEDLWGEGGLTTVFGLGGYT